MNAPATLNAPAPSTFNPALAPLNERAVLIDLSISVYDGRKVDNKLTKKITRDSGADDDSGRWWTYTVPKSAIRPIINAANRGRTYNYEHTLAWENSGARILPAETFFEHTSELRKLEADFRAEVENFLRAYPELVKNAANRLGKLYHPENFPSVRELRDRFEWTAGIKPIPAGGDFRVALGNDVLDGLRASLEDQKTAILGNATRELWGRLYEVIEKFVKTLNNPDKIFRDSLIGNVTELTDLLPKLNIAGDAELEATRQEVLKKLVSQNPDVLRENKVVRADATKAALDIADKIASFLIPAK